MSIASSNSNNMLTVIQYNEVGQMDSLFAFPKPHHEEYVEHNTAKELHDYILSQKDSYGNQYDYANRDSGFVFVSKMGFIEVGEYQPPVILNITHTFTDAVH